MKTMEQPTINQRNTKSTKTLTLIEVLVQIKENELNRPFMHCFLFLTFFTFVFFF